MTFSESQLTSDESIELRLKDKSKIDKKTPLTSDEALYEISEIKKSINQQILKAVKESAIDCALHSTSDSKEKLVCYSFSNSKNPDEFAYYPTLTGEEKDLVSGVLNKEKIKWKAREIKVKGVKYALNEETNIVYDIDSYNQALNDANVQPIELGKIEKVGNRMKLIWN